MTDWTKASQWAVKDIRDGIENGYSAETIWKDLLGTLRHHGYVLLPVKPTEGMLDSGVALALNVTVTGEGGWTKYISALYTAMQEAHEREIAGK
jgi:hypothetical protein